MVGYRVGASGEPGLMGLEHEQVSAGSPPSGSESPRGDRIQNPVGQSILVLAHQIFRVHDSSLAGPGWWAMMVHPCAEARMSVRLKPLRAVLLDHSAMYLTVRWFLGIEPSTAVPAGGWFRLCPHRATVIQDLDGAVA